VIGDDINGCRGTFKVVKPDSEGFVDSEQFLIMDVVIQFRGGEGSGVERHRMEFAIFGHNGKNCGEGVVRGVSFNDNRPVRDPMSKDGSRGKGFLQ